MTTNSWVSFASLHEEGDWYIATTIYENEQKVVVYKAKNDKLALTKGRNLLDLTRSDIECMEDDGGYFSVDKCEIT